MEKSIYFSSKILRRRLVSRNNWRNPVTFDISPACQKNNWSNPVIGVTVAMTVKTCCVLQPSIIGFGVPDAEEALRRSFG